MEDLIKLVEIVSKNKVKNIEVIGNPSNYQSNLQKLYDGIVSKRFDTSKDAENFLFPKDPKQSEKFNRLKKRLTNRLMNTLFFIDVNQPRFNDAQKAYYNCYKDFAAMKVLIGRGEKGNSIKLAERVLKRSLQYEFTDLSVNVLKDLRNHYGTISSDWKKFRKYNQLLDEQFEIFRIELKAENYYLDIARHFVSSNATKKEVGEVAIKYAEDLGKYLDHVNTQRFILMAYNVIAMRYEIFNSYKKVVEISEKAIDLFEKKGKRKINTFKVVFLSKKINALIKLGDLEKSEQAIIEALALIEKNGINWIILKDLHLKLLFHAEKYQNAYTVFTEVFDEALFIKYPINYIEQWKLYNAYIHYLITSGKINISEKEKSRLGKFRLGKFLNEIPVYSKDKRGGNIQVLILQLLFLILNKQYEKAESQLNALKSYANRYLKKDSTFRSNCFIHMLMQLPKSYFNKKAAVRKAQKYWDRLSEVPLQTADQSAELEIIPYEHLWQMVLDSLKG